MKKLTALASAVLLLTSFTGCASGTETQTLLSKGGYREEQVLFPYAAWYYGVFSDFFTLGGTTEFYDSSTEQFYSFNDDLTVIERAGRGLLAGEDNDYPYDVLAASDNGILLRKYKGEKVEYLVKDAEGKTSELTANYVISADFSSDGRLFVLCGDGLREVDLSTGKSELLSPDQSCIVMEIAGDVITVAGSEGTYFYDINTGTKKDAPKSLSDFFKDKLISEENGFTGDVIMCEGDNGSVYVCCSDGLYRFMVEGNQIEQLLDGAVNTIGSPTFKLNSMYCNDDGTVIITSTDGRMLKYIYDPDMDVETASELKIYSLDKNDTLSQVIYEFAADNKSVKVNYHRGRNAGMTYDDAMKDLTTQILSGDAPDIIMIDGMDTRSLKDKNMLCDLSQWKEQWIPEGGILENVACWNTSDDELLSVSCKFRIPAVGAEKKYLDSIHSFHDLAVQTDKLVEKEKPDHVLMNIYSPEGYIRTGLMFEGKDFLKDLTAEKLTRFFTDCCTVLHNDYSSDDLYTVYSSISDGIPDEYCFTPRYIYGLTEPVFMAVGAVNGFENDYNILFSGDDIKTTDMEYRLGISEDSRSFVPVCSLAVAEAGKNHEDAVRFIGYALRSESQSTEQHDGFPVNSDALSGFLRKYKGKWSNETTMSIPTFSGDSELLTVKWPDNRNGAEFSKFVKTLDEPLVIDYSTRGIIEDAGTKCLLGSLTPEEAALTAMRQLELKMKE